MAAEATSKGKVKERVRALPTAEARLSPRNNNGSSLYDSFELRALTYQLNKAMQLHRASGSSSSSSSPAYLCYLKSPFSTQRLDRVNRENSRAPNIPKKVVCSHLTCATINRDETSKSKSKTKEVVINRGGLAAKLWNKLKQGLLLKAIVTSNNKQRNELRDV